MKKAVLVFTLTCFLTTGNIGLCPVEAQDFLLPAPGSMVHLSPQFDPPILKGIKVYPDQPFRFDFILDRGEGKYSDSALKEESTTLIKYFLASLTVPEKELWVNLSPYEKDRIIPEAFGLTEMGRDLLAEDYLLKQVTASLIYPNDNLGKVFWKRVYEEAQKRYGTTEIPVNTFNKVWIIPDKAVVYENARAGTAYVIKDKLKVMLEEDYLSLSKHQGQPGDMASALSPSTLPNGKGLKVQATQRQKLNALGTQIVREIVIPQLTREINEGRNFSRLRQVYDSLILAAWYKQKIRNSILAQGFENRNKVAGVNSDDPQEKQRIYNLYLQAFKKGVFNYISEEIDPLTRQETPKHYFSGGMLINPRVTVTDNLNTAASAAPKDGYIVSAGANMITTFAPHLRFDRQGRLVAPFYVLNATALAAAALRREEKSSAMLATIPLVALSLLGTGALVTLVWGIAQGIGLNKVKVAQQLMTELLPLLQDNKVAPAFVFSALDVLQNREDFEASALAKDTRQKYGRALLELTNWLDQRNTPEIREKAYVLLFDATSEEQRRGFYRRLELDPDSSVIYHVRKTLRLILNPLPEGISAHLTQLLRKPDTTTFEIKENATQQAYVGFALGKLTDDETVYIKHRLAGKPFRLEKEPDTGRWFLLALKSDGGLPFLQNQADQLMQFAGSRAMITPAVTAAPAVDYVEREKIRSVIHDINNFFNIIKITADMIQAQASSYPPAFSPAFAGISHLIPKIIATLPQLYSLQNMDEVAIRLQSLRMQMEGIAQHTLILDHNYPALAHDLSWSRIKRTMSRLQDFLNENISWNEKTKQEKLQRVSVYQAVDHLAPFVFSGNVGIFNYSSRDDRSHYISVNISGLERVFNNLVVNAKQAIDADPDRKARGEGRIEVRTQYHDDQVLISIADNGPGIPETIINRIFDRKFTTRPTGNGIGLDDCRNIIESFGGTITVASKVGEGTTFTISLPLAMSVGEKQAFYLKRGTVLHDLRNQLGEVLALLRLMEFKGIPAGVFPDGFENQVQDLLADTQIYKSSYPNAGSNDLQLAFGGPAFKENFMKDMKLAFSAFIEDDDVMERLSKGHFIIRGMVLTDDGKGTTTGWRINPNFYIDHRLPYLLETWVHAQGFTPLQVIQLKMMLYYGSPSSIVNLSNDQVMDMMKPRDRKAFDDFKATTFASLSGMIQRISEKESLLASDQAHELGPVYARMQQFLRVAADCFKGNDEFKPTYFNLHEMINDIWDSPGLVKLREQKPEITIDYNTVFNPEDVKVYADRSKLDEAVRILVKNGIEAIQTNGSGKEYFTVSGIKEKNNIVLEIATTGGAMTEEQIADVMARHAHAASTKIEEGKGEGFGLISVLDIVTAHHGKFEIIPNILKHSTLMRIILPLPREQSLESEPSGVVKMSIPQGRPELVSAAMVHGRTAVAGRHEGGIDLTAAPMALETKNGGGAIAFKIDPAMLQDLEHSAGLEPFVIDMKPLKDLRAFLSFQSI